VTDKEKRSVTDTEILATGDRTVTDAENDAAGDSVNDSKDRVLEPLDDENETTTVAVDMQ
jgi:hypothetical protein